MSDNSQIVPPGDAQPSLTRTVTIENPDEFVYANMVGVTTTPWDVRISFGDYAPTKTDDHADIKAKIGVVMSPEQALMLTKILLDQLKKFEPQYGPIRNKGFGVKSLSE